MPPTLGQRLRHAREARGLTVEDVTHQTRIPAQRLRDLEEDRYTGTGSLTYAKSFLTTYSKMLGVDASSVLDHIQPPPLGGARDYRYLVENHGHWIDEDSSDAMMGAPGRMVSAPRSIGLAALICAVAAGLTLVGWKALAGSSSKAGTAYQAKPAAEQTANAQANPAVDPADQTTVRRAQLPDANDNFAEARPVQAKPIPRAEIVR